MAGDEVDDLVQPSSRHRQAPETKAQWPPCSDSRIDTYGLPVTRGSRKGCDGTNGSSAAVMIGRHADPVDQTHRARLEVVVFGAGKTEVRRREDLVEVADGSNRLEQ